MADSFEDILTFILSRMRMSHVYQPVMIQTLLDNCGEASQETIAKSLLSYDQAQIEYHENITSSMVGKVLRNHGFITKERAQPYRLVDFESLSPSRIKELHTACLYVVEPLWTHSSLI
jgi:hypothetical protein